MFLRSYFLSSSQKFSLNEKGMHDFEVLNFPTPELLKNANIDYSNFHNIAIIWTNQVMINPGVFYGDPVTAIGGTVLAHKSTYRVYFKKSSEIK